MEAETGAMWLDAKKCQGPLGRRLGTRPHGASGRSHPANTLILNLWPPGLGESNSALF